MMTAATRLLASSAGLVAGYALALWVGLCPPSGDCLALAGLLCVPLLACLTWGALAATCGVGVLAHEAARLLHDDGGGPEAGRRRPRSRA